MNRWWWRGARWAGWILIGYWTLTVSLYLGARGLFPARPVDLSWPVRLVGLLMSLGFWLRDPRIRPVARIASVASIAAISPWAGFFGLVGFGGWMWRQRSLQGTTVGYRWIPLWPLRLLLPDRFLHLHVVGPTGSGKSSSVLMPLIAQDVKAGYGLLLLDPKGDLAWSAYQAALAHHRSVIWLNPQASDCPHFNPLAGPAAAAAEGLNWALNRISQAGHPYYAVTSRIWLTHSVTVIKHQEGEAADIGTLLTFLRQDTLQRRWAENTPDPAAQSFFAEVTRAKNLDTHRDRQGLIHRLELLWANPHLRRLFSAPADFTWDDVLSQSTVVLCPVSLAEFGASATVLGTLIWHSLAQAAYRRAPGLAHPPYFLYIDEFQEFVTPDLGHFLALARGYRVGMTLAHQTLGQLTPDIQAAVLANARQRIWLSGLAVDDYATLSRIVMPHQLPDDFRYWPQGRAVAHLTVQGRMRPPQTVRLPWMRLESPPTP